MSIIFVPDPHGSICPIIQIGIELRPSAIITVGDNEFKRKPYATLFKPLFDVGIHVYTVDGNHDRNSTYLRCNEKYRLDGKVVEIDGKRVAGSSIYARGSSDGEADILVSHHPARAWNSSTNSTFYAEMTLAEAKRRKAGIVFHGHIHPRYDQKDTGLYIEQGVRCVSLGKHVYDECGRVVGFIWLNKSRDAMTFYRGTDLTDSFLGEWSAHEPNDELSFDLLKPDSEKGYSPFSFAD